MPICVVYLYGRLGMAQAVRAFGTARYAVCPNFISYLATQLTTGGRGGIIALVDSSDYV